MKNRRSICPNLPEGTVVEVMISQSACLAIQALQNTGVSCLTTEPCPQLPSPVRFHADMLCYPLGQEEILVTRGNVALFSKLKQHAYHPSFTKRELRPDYPGDILLNAAQIGSVCFASPFCDEALQEAWKKRNVCLIPVRQGYAKCSTVVVSKEACITADPSIADAAEKSGLDVLRIRAGFVELPGYPYGFLGGACGKISEDVLAFAGDLRTHPDNDRISSFLANYHMIPLSLYGGPLQDIGGILPLREEAEKRN